MDKIKTLKTSPDSGTNSGTRVRRHLRTTLCKPKFGYVIGDLMIIVTRLSFSSAGSGLNFYKLRWLTCWKWVLAKDSILFFFVFSFLLFLMKNEIAISSTIVFLRMRAFFWHQLTLIRGFLGPSPSVFSGKKSRIIIGDVTVGT